jgi:hypothetical protein
MTVTRTPDIDVDKEFTVDVPVTKAYVGSDGRRHIVGVATGVAEDRDGERVSKNCIVGMGRDIESGAIKVTSSHQQDWMTEIGDVEKYQYDAETDEMIVDGVLPPEGVDPIADKAWRTAQEPNATLGWSIGGKLLKSFYERNEVGKKRKVLDAIRLRHIMLTKNPSYAQSFATAVVAKAFDGDEPADDEFTLEAEVEKDMTTGSWAGGGSDVGGGNTGRDSVGSGQRNAGSKDPKSKGMNTEDDGANENEDDKDLPEAKDQERHLACPNCGHEFAADLPVDPGERQVDETNDETNDEDEDRETGKSLEETQPMSKLSETIDDLRALANAETVEKTDQADTVTDVPKADEDLGDVAKMVAASHRAHEERFADMEGKLGTAFELIAKAVKGVQEQIADLPQGRKSVARVHPDGNGAPSTVGHADGSVEKTAEERIAETDDPVEALKILNASTYGTR